MMRTLFVLCGAGLLVAAGAVRPAPAAPRIEVTPPEALVDELVKITVRGLKPDRDMTLRLEVIDGDGGLWVSHGVFVADERGVVDLASSAPEPGTYEGVDPMGLFWSLRPAGLEEDVPYWTARFVLDLEGPMKATLRALDHGDPLASAELSWRGRRDGVVARKVDADGLVGTLYLPPGAGPHPGIVVLGGSDGGVDHGGAALLASHGYAALALAYFRADGLPANLVEIPLEYFEKGIAWLAGRDEIDGKRLGILGASKGAEASLVVASSVDSIRAVVAYVPTSVVWSGIGERGAPPASSWTRAGKEVPYLGVRPGADFAAQLGSGKPLRLRGIYVSGLEDEDGVARAVIPVETINGPVLLVSGGDDQLWPSEEMGEQIVARLKEKSFPHAVGHLRFPEAGHRFFKGYLPATSSIARPFAPGMALAFGGSPEANAKASIESWNGVLAFLREHL